MSIEAIELALEALRKAMQGNLVFDEAMEAFKSLEKSLAQPEQEPVAWYHAEDYKTHFTTNPSPDLIGKYWKPLYTTPPQPKEPKQEQGAPVAVVTGVYGGRFIVEPTNSAMVLPVNMALYAHPQPRKPLTHEQMKKIWYAMQNIMGWYSFQEIARAIEAAHNIKE